MIITAIKQQLKRQDRYSIYIDGKYECAFSEAELLRLGLSIGQEMSPADLDQLRADSLHDKARYQALNQIARRPRSVWELRDYLHHKDYQPEVIDAVVYQLQQIGYLDDYEFATSWVTSRRLLKATSKRRLKQELRQKRVSDEVINQVLAEDEADETDILRELIDRKRKQSRYQDDLKLTAYLMRQGYSYQDVKAAVADSVGREG